MLVFKRASDAESLHDNSNPKMTLNQMLMNSQSPGQDSESVEVSIHIDSSDTNSPQKSPDPMMQKSIAVDVENVSEEK